MSITSMGPSLSSYSLFTPPFGPVKAPLLTEMKTPDETPVLSKFKPSSLSKFKLSSPLRTTRQILPFTKNLTPSVQLDPSEKADNIFNRELAVEHAAVRIQIFYIKAMAVYNFGKRSDGSIEEDLVVDVGHARKQGGQGSNGTHAAHADTAGGLFDNKRELIRSQILEENVITPKKRKIIQAVSRESEEDTEKDMGLLLSSNKKIAKTAFNRIWPKLYAEESFFEASRLNDVANTTHELPAELNLQCDCALERAVRPHISEIFKDIMKGNISPEDATKLYVTMIKTYFIETIDKLKKHICKMETYHANIIDFDLKGLSKSTQKPCKDLKKDVEELKKSEALLVPIPKWKENYDIKLFQKNTSFLDLTAEILKAQKAKDSSANLHLLREKQIVHHKQATNEILQKINSMTNLLIYCETELEGTIVPEFEKLCGKYDPDTKKHVMLSPSSREEFQYSLIHTKTPPKQKPKKTPLK